VTQTTVTPDIVPRTVTEWIENYDYLVRAVVTRMIKHNIGTVDDLSQEIWTQFIRGRIDPQTGRRISYAEIFDPSKGAPTTFLWEFTRVRCHQYISKMSRTPTAYAVSIQTQADDNFQIGIVDPETTTELSFDEFREIEFQDLLQRATKAVHRHRIRGRRDLRWVWYLIIRGFRQDQIAKEMGLSEGTISICMDLIRDIPEVQELKKWGVEQGLLVNPMPL